MKSPNIFFWAANLMFLLGMIRLYNEIIREGDSFAWLLVVGIMILIINIIFIIFILKEKKQ